MDESSWTIPPAPAGTEDPAVRPALDRLAAKAPIGGSTLQVELADSLLHFDVVHGEFGGLAARTLSSLAEACVAELLGEQADEFSVRWQLQRDERHLLVCALPTPWLRRAESAAAAHDLRLESVRPHFSRHWNRWLAAQPAGNAVFAVAEQHQAVIACVRGGVIVALSSGPWFADHAEFSDSSVERLLAGIGLVGKERTAMIDLQVDRLLAGLGVDPFEACEYLLVSEAEPHPYLSDRWSVQRTTGGAS
jgi:hypothetical protein